MRSTIAVIVGSLLLSFPVFAQDSQDDGVTEESPGADEPLPGTQGAGVFHGNYCGVGDNGPGLPPTDALDAACMHHDACTPAGGFPSCACNARFLHEVRAVARDPSQPGDLRATAVMVAASVPVIPCHE